MNQDNLVAKFILEMGRCLCSKAWLNIALVLFLLSGVVIAFAVGGQKMNDVRAKGENKAIGNVVTADSTIYRQLADKIAECENVVKNYQADADFVLDRANTLIAVWLGCSTTLVAIIIGLSVWTNYKQENSYKESVEKLKDDIERIRRNQEATERINKIGSIMTCLNSLPDPLLSEMNADRRKYVNNHLSLIHDEFSELVKLVEDGENNVSIDMRYLQLVLSALKISILRAQSVYSDAMSSLAFFTFSKKLDETVHEIQRYRNTGRNVAEKLGKVLDEFDAFLGELPR